MSAAFNFLEGSVAITKFAFDIVNTSGSHKSNLSQWSEARSEKESVQSVQKENGCLLKSYRSAIKMKKNYANVEKEIKLVSKIKCAIEGKVSRPVSVRWPYLHTFPSKEIAHLNKIQKVIAKSFLKFRNLYSRILQHSQNARKWHYISGSFRSFLGHPVLQSVHSRARVLADVAGKGTNIFAVASLVICSRRSYSRCGPADSISRQPRSCLLALRLVDDNRAYPPLGFTRRMSRLRI